MLNKDFKEFITLLNSTHVEYMVVGGYALAVHGHPRYTGDIDLWIRPSVDNIQRVLAALHAFGFGGLGLKAEDFLTPEAVIQLGYPPARIDLLTAIDGVTFDECYPKRLRVELADIQLPVIDLDSFKANKRASARPKDLADLSELAAPGADTSLVKDTAFGKPEAGQIKRTGFLAGQTQVPDDFDRMGEGEIE